MRKTLALFSVAALLVVLLVGCGQKTNSSTGGNGGSGSGTTQSGGLNTGSTGTTNGTGGADTNGGTGDTGSMGSGDTANGSGTMTNNGSTVTGSVIGGMDGSRNTNASANAQLRGSSNSMTGTVATPGTMLDGDEQYRRMLANAHVHDTDGFLLDGENAQYVTW